MFHIEILVKQTPPQGDGFPGEVGIHLIRDPIDRDTRVDADLPVLGFAGKRTEALPTAHRPDAGGGQVVEPILETRVRFSPVLHRIIAQQELLEPRIGFIFGLGLMEMIERFVHFLHRAEGPLHFALGTGRDASAIATSGHVRTHVYPQITHDLLKDETPRDGTVIHIMCPFVLCGRVAPQAVVSRQSPRWWPHNAKRDGYGYEQ